MKNKFWFLTNYTFGRIKKPLLLIAGLMVLSEALALFITAGSMEFYTFPYELMVDVALIPYIFAFSVIAIIIMLTLKFRSFYSKQRGIYSLFTLPIKRQNILFSNIIVAFSGILFLVVVQLIVAVVLYFPTEAIANSLRQPWNTMNEGTTTIYVDSYGAPMDIFATVNRDNGLFLAFIRNYFLRILAPFDFEGILIFISVISTCAVLPTYAFSINFDSPVRFRSLAALILTIAALSYLFINGFGPGVTFSIILLILNSYWVLSVLKQYEESTMLYRGEK